MIIKIIYSKINYKKFIKNHYFDYLVSFTLFVPFICFIIYYYISYYFILSILGIKFVANYNYFLYLYFSENNVQ
jgi:hypothetical protein